MSDRVSFRSDGSASVVDFAQDGWTPLRLAASNGHEGVVRLLLDSKAAVDAADKVGGMIWVLGWLRYLCLGQTRGRVARCDIISARNLTMFVFSRRLCCVYFP